MLDCHQMYFSLFLFLGHSHIMVYAKCTPFDSLFSGCFHLRILSLLSSPVIFIICYPKTPFLCWNTPNFHATPWKTPFSLKTLIFVTKRPLLFWVNIVTEIPLLFKCPMYVTLYKSCAPGVYHHPSHCSLPVNVCLSHWGHAPNT